MTIEGASDTPKAELESQTLKLARDLGLDTARLRVMHVDEKSAIRAGSLRGGSHIAHPREAQGAGQTLCGTITVMADFKFGAERLKECCHQGL